jgi:hypothetical protein
MIHVRKSELVSFFGAEPKPQPKGEEDFQNFVFSKRVGEIGVWFTVSANFGIASLDLTLTSTEEPFFGYHLTGVSSASIEPSLDGRTCLMLYSKSGAELSLSLDPTVEVNIEKDATD